MLRVDSTTTTEAENFFYAININIISINFKSNINDSAVSVQ